MKETESLVTERVEGAPDPEVRAYRPPQRYSAAYKQRILAEYEQLDREGKGALLRREGLYTHGADRSQKFFAVHMTGHFPV